jgi:hypothetical protein
LTDKKEVVIVGKMDGLTKMLTEVLIEVPSMLNATLSAISIVFKVIRNKGENNEQVNGKP